MNSALPLRDAASVFINLNIPITQPVANQLMHFVTEMSNLKKRRLVLLMSSSGGDPDAALSAYNFLNGVAGIQIVTHNMGTVSNIQLYCVGHVRTCTPNAVFNFEDFSLLPAAGIERAYDLAENLKSLRIVRFETAKIIARTVGRTEDKILQLMRQSYTMRAEEAIKFKLAQRIEEKPLQAGDLIIDIEKNRYR